ncbi:unnamed protein product [Penicillium pancosmium]
MTLHLSLPLLLACAFPIILAAPSSSAYLQTDTPTQFPTGNTNPEPLLLVPEAEGDTGSNPETGRLLSRNDEPQEPVIYGKDDSERQIAIPPFTTDNLDTDSPFTLPSTGFLVATFAAFCVLAMIRKSMGRRSAPQQDGKK